METSRAHGNGRIGDGNGLPALVICGHGSHLNPDSSAPVYDHAARIRDRGTFPEVREAFWKEEPSLRNALRTVEAEDVIVVPLFTSEGYFTEGVIPRELRLGDDGDESDGDDDDGNGGGGSTLDVAKRVWYTDPVGIHPSMTDVIVKSAERITGDPEVGPETGLAVIGHGTERNPKSAKATRDHAARIDERERFAEVEALFMDQAPFVDDAQDHFSTRSIVAVPLFVADGFHTREEIPELLGLDGEFPDYENPSDVGGRRVWYAGAVGTEPSFSDVIEERAREVLSRAPDADARLADPDGRGDDGDARTETEAVAARRAFLDRVERDIEANGTSTWGELAITVDVGHDGGTAGENGKSNADRSRAYELRHRDDLDLGADSTALDTHADPYRARSIARFDDDDGEYRPLKSAPTLAHGWRLAELSGRDLWRAISYFYPASVENWSREISGTLDITHYAETAARQTGMYDPVAELRGRDLDRAVRACCTDDVCLKRRVWEAGESGVGSSDGDGTDGSAGGNGREIDAPRGDGEFPCREPCSLFVAAAREFVLAEREADDADGSAGPAHAALTDVDREHLDAILTDLVEGAEGVTTVRDGDVSEPTNRYRVRYLREKLRDLDERKHETDHAATEHAAPSPGGED